MQTLTTFVQGGGTKRIYTHRGRTFATVVQLPGTLVRVFWTDAARMSGYADYSTLQAAYDAVYDAETRVNHSKEARFNDLLICIASGLTVEQTLDSLPDATVDELCEAHQEALKQGIEPEDIAPSWRRIGY